MLQVRQGEAKLFDLRFARQGMTFSESVEGTQAYMSPEMLGCKEYTRKTDIYSLAICLWELWYGHPVYSKPYYLGPDDFVKSVTGGQTPSCDHPIAMPHSLQALLFDCWKMHSDKRPEAFKVLKKMQVIEYE